ncbi:MAG: AAA family ATPase [Gemmataceae bacterium]|nr:AAA family ATPase [Gemmataceae bacterium]
MLVKSPSMPIRPALARLLATPENRSALSALQDVVAAVMENTADKLPNPLYLFGPSGTGKTHLVQAVAAELTKLEIEVCTFSANDFAAKDDFTDARETDLWIVEDLQHLPARFENTLIDLIDARRVHGLPTICTALQGPSVLRHRGASLPHRLTNRLAGGLVVALEPMQTASRRRLLEALAHQARQSVSPEILDWLAEHLIGGGRQLAGAVRQMKTLAALQRKPLTLADVRAHFRAEVEAKAPTVQRITARVSAYYQVKPKLVFSARRSHDVLVPRQLSMYLSRQLTHLSLEKIGVFFGGRDHKTVQHACNKIECAMKSNAALSSIVRQLRAELA